MANFATFLQSRLAAIALLGLVCFVGGLTVLTVNGLARGRLAPLDALGLIAAIATVFGAVIASVAFGFYVGGRRR